VSKIFLKIENSRADHWSVDDFSAVTSGPIGALTKMTSASQSPKSLSPVIPSKTESKCPHLDKQKFFLSLKEKLIEKFLE